MVNQPIPFWNLPNILTLLRIAMIPVVAMLLIREPSATEAAIACVIFVVAMITDIIDGYLARKWNLMTPMGAYLDPLADKLMVITTMVMLIPLGWVPAWLVALLICREVTITGLRGIASQQNLVIAASPTGKIKTAFQSTALGMLLWHHPFPFPIIGETDVHSTGIVLLIVSLFFSLVSAAEYFWLYAVAARASKA